MAAEAKGYSLWIKPYGQTSFDLQARIDTLAETFGTSKFEPHITLFPGLEDSEASLINSTDILAHNLTPFEFTLTKIGYGDHYFHALYINVEQTPELMHTRELAERIFDMPPPRNFNPHLSLMYCDFTIHEKARITNTEKQVYNLSFEVHGLHLVKTQGTPDKWEKIHYADFGSNQ